MKIFQQHLSGEDDQQFESNAETADVTMRIKRYRRTKRTRINKT